MRQWSGSLQVCRAKATPVQTRLRAWSVHSVTQFSSHPTASRPRVARTYSLNADLSLTADHLRRRLLVLLSLLSSPVPSPTTWSALSKSGDKLLRRLGNFGIAVSHQLMRHYSLGANSPMGDAFPLHFQRITR